MKMIITINMDNAAFDGEPGVEVSRILRKLADEYVESGCDLARYKLRDINGNIVGRVEVAK